MAQTKYYHENLHYHQLANVLDTTRHMVNSNLALHAK